MLPGNLGWKGDAQTQETDAVEKPGRPFFAQRSLNFVLRSLQTPGVRLQQAGSFSLDGSGCLRTNHEAVPPTSACCGCDWTLRVTDTGSLTGELVAQPGRIGLAL